MSHVDEGTLHAYLDGEVPAGPERRALETHLVSCVSCRAALVEARTLRQKSAAVLRQSGPADDSAPPPFEEIRERARARSVGRDTRRLSRFRMLAWAATVVIAAGVGSVVTMQFRAEPTASPSRAPDDMARSEAEESPGTPGSRTQGARQGAPAETRESSDRAAGAGRTAAAPALRDELGAMKVELREAPPTPEVGVPSAPAARAPVPPANEERKPDIVAREPAAAVEADARAEFARARAVKPAAADSDSNAERPRATPEAAAGAAGRADDPAETWMEVTKETAAAALGGNVATIEGLAVDRYGLRDVAGRPQVRIAQRTESGVEVELVQWRTRDITIMSDLVTLPAAQLRDSLATVTVQRADYTIRARAKVSPQTLRDLVRRIP